MPEALIPSVKIKTGAAVNALGDNRRSILKLPFCDLMAVLRGELHGELPRDAELVSVYMDYRDSQVCLVLQSPDYHPVLPGARIPFITAPLNRPPETARKESA